jgi:nucleoside-diphosphate-sugar epimerase
MGMRMASNRLGSDLDHILNHTRDLWNELRGQQLFVTGGTGFFGSWVLESFLWANERLDLQAKVSVLTRSADTFIARRPHLALNPAVSLVQGDVRTFSFPAEKFSYIIHAATDSSAKLNLENPAIMLDTILQGTRRTLDFALTCGTSKFLLTSSGAIYGRQPAELSMIPEEYSGGPDPLDPRSAYGEGKRTAEQLCAIYSRNSPIEMKIARCFAFVGPYLPLDKHFAIGNFIRDGANGLPITVQGDGTPLRSYLYGADLAIWLWTILFRGQSCRPYNVGGKESISIAELALRVAKLSQPTPKVIIEGQPITGRRPDRYIPSTQRAKEELGLISWIRLDDSISRTLEWLRDVK